jgi:hypothetical protein
MLRGRGFRTTVSLLSEAVGAVGASEGFLVLFFAVRSIVEGFFMRTVLRLSLLFFLFFLFFLAFLALLDLNVLLVLNILLVRRRSTRRVLFFLGVGLRTTKLFIDRLDARRVVLLRAPLAPLLRGDGLGLVVIC